jgi:hypothetical protein
MSKTNAKGKKNRAMPADVSFADPTITVTLDSECECVDVCPSKQHSLDAQQEAIRVLAHEKWEAAGCPAGDGVNFWLDAEQEVTA